MNYDNIQKRLPPLIEQLRSMNVTYLTDAKAVGEAIGYLRLLETILKGVKND